jgi:FixJ family two-component response regulator
MNGVELAKIARHRLPTVPVLFMTGYADAGLLPLNTTDDVLKKPFQAWELETKVMQAAGRTRVNRKLP